MDNNKTQLYSPPYYAVIFVSQRTQNDHGYDEMAQRMLQLAQQQPGFLGVDSARNSLQGITVSYWKNEQAIAAWKQQIEHQQAQAKGRELWYEHYQVHVSKVERYYEFETKIDE